MRHLRTFAPLALLTVSLALVSACAVGPNYSRPEMPAPPAHRFFEGEAQAQPGKSTKTAEATAPTGGAATAPVQPQK